MKDEDEIYFINYNTVQISHTNNLKVKKNSQNKMKGKSIDI